MNATKLNSKNLRFGLILQLHIALISIHPVLAQQGASPRDLLKQYVAELQQNPNDNALREKIIKLAAGLKPPPEISEEARRHFVRAVTVQKEAKDTSRYELAISEYQKALFLAPWWNDAYFNLGSALEMAGRFDEAIQALKLYLFTGPSSADARAAQDRIYSLEAKKELAQRQEQQGGYKSAEVAKQIPEDIDAQFIKNLDGARYILWSQSREGSTDMTYEIRGHQVHVTDLFRGTGNFPDDRHETTYKIQRRQFWISVPERWCQSSYQTNNCGYLGIISENGITFNFQADGRNVTRIVAGPPDYIPRAR